MTLHWRAALPAFPRPPPRRGWQRSEHCSQSFVPRMTRRHVWGGTPGHRRARSGSTSPLLRDFITDLMGCRKSTLAHPLVTTRLQSRDSCKRVTSDTENVLRRIEVTLMHDPAAGTRPHSYAECAQSTRAAACEAVRARHTRPGCIDCAVRHSKPTGFVRQECAQLAPSGIVDGWRHARLTQLGAGHIADDH